MYSVCSYQEEGAVVGGVHLGGVRDEAAGLVAGEHVLQQARARAPRAPGARAPRGLARAAERVRHLARRRVQRGRHVTDHHLHETTTAHASSY